MSDKPGLKGHKHHWYASDSNADYVWWSCAGCDKSKRTASAGRHLNNALAAIYANAGASAALVDIRHAMKALEISEDRGEWEHWSAGGDSEWLA